MVIQGKWICEICHSCFDHKEEAQKCEESHVSYEFEPLFVLGEEYPPSILLVKKADDGRVLDSVLYTREDEIIKKEPLKKAKK